MLNRTLTTGVALAMTLGASAGVLAQTPIPPSPKDFAAAVAGSDQYEMLAAAAALAQSRDEHVRTYAQEMLRDHQRLDGELRQAVRTAGLPEPEPAMAADQAHLLGGLQGVVGTEFDRMYAGQQVLAHTQAVAVQDSFAASGKEPNLQKAARSALPAIRDHLLKAQQLRQDLGMP